MGMGSFIFLCIIVVAIAWIGVWALNEFLPGHPPIVDKLIWGVAVLIILFNLFSALGLLSYDPQIPRIVK